MLSYYAERLSTVEINYTFRTIPSEKVVASWAQQTHDTFRFVLKAPKAVTHVKRLKDVEKLTDQFLDAAMVLNGQRGPLLFQLPHTFKKDLTRLESFLKVIDNKALSAFEFRHESWYDGEIIDCLRAHSSALCAADVDDVPSTNLVKTTDWGYVRLRCENYTDDQLREWIGRIKSHGWSEAYVFFKHEDTATGPKLAARFLDLLKH